jgi:hypothetical protein
MLHGSIKADNPPKGVNHPIVYSRITRIIVQYIAFLNWIVKFVGIYLFHARI